MKPPHACLHLNNKAYFLLPSADEEADMEVSGLYAEMR